ncbi:MAG TPA: protoporphyrinogen oxidase, partial [Candidatus Polarisedimenticolia bacterium]|nr:protoporphyrinogen oxidase [Candidatus Polarisedimenticolia bacterium]
LLEAGDRPGGVIRTERRDGFLIEGGPDCFITDRPWAIDLCRRLGLEEEILGTNPSCRRSFILRNGRIVPIPEGYQLLAPSRFLPFATSPIMSLAGKLRVACDLVLPRGPEVSDESLATFVRRRFGAEALESLAQPLVAGIYNADPENLSLRATFPRFLDMERSHRSVILALLRARRRMAGANAGVSGARYSLFATLRGGLQSLVDRLASALPAGALRLGTAVSGLERRAGGFVVTTAPGERIAADAVVLALPARSAAPLLGAIDPEMEGSLASIPYGTSITVTLAYRRADVPHALDGFGFVVPRSEKRTVAACTFSSVKFAGRAPEGSILLRAFLGGPSYAGPGRADGAPTDSERLVRAVRDDLRDILGVTAAPLFAVTYVWQRLMAQYQVGHLERVAAVDRRLAAHPDLALAGNGLRGVGIPDCVRSGELAAERIVAACLLKEQTDQKV